MRPILITMQVSEVVLLVGEMLLCHRSRLIEIIRNAKEESRSARAKGFRAYYTELEEEHGKIQDNIMGILIMEASIRILDQDSFKDGINRAFDSDPHFLYYELSKIALKIRLLDNKLHSTRPKKYILQPENSKQCLEYCLQIFSHYRGSKAFNSNHDKYIYCRMIEDCCFDKFRVDIIRLQEIAECYSELPLSSEFLEFVAEVNLNCGSFLNSKSLYLFFALALCTLFVWWLCCVFEEELPERSVRYC